MRRRRLPLSPQLPPRVLHQHPRHHPRSRPKQSKVPAEPGQVAQGVHGQARRDPLNRRNVVVLTRSFLFHQRKRQLQAEGDQLGRQRRGHGDHRRQHSPLGRRNKEGPYSSSLSPFRTRTTIHLRTLSPTAAAYPSTRSARSSRRSTSPRRST